jgi:hypothetical protein
MIHQIISLMNKINYKVIIVNSILQILELDKFLFKIKYNKNNIHNNKVKINMIKSIHYRIKRTKFCKIINLKLIKI